MSDQINQLMWLALFEIAEYGKTAQSKSTQNALQKRNLIYQRSVGYWQPTKHGLRMIEYVTFFDVSEAKR